ncbi:Hypothetical predicted protein [Podarcis lilfordi]|uniref:Uncharacterized protein n=1 Tax=Podarcis lilfordi TaxID=74358 RepID=A0AA35PJW4_9SAUR|nr:Hypothetical predicted protein [Podarcis lilfordi]
MPPELASPAEDDLLMPQVPPFGRKRLQRRRSRRGGQRRTEMMLTLPHRAFNMYKALCNGQKLTVIPT